MGKSNAKKQKHCGYIKPHELRDSMTGEVMSTEVLTPSPVSAVPATAIVSDEEQQYVSAPATGPVPSNVVHIQPGQAMVGGKIIDLASLPVPRAFRSCREY